MQLLQAAAPCPPRLGLPPTWGCRCPCGATVWRWPPLHGSPREAGLALCSAAGSDRAVSVAAENRSGRPRRRAAGGLVEPGAARQAEEADGKRHEEAEPGSGGAAKRRPAQRPGRARAYDPAAAAAVAAAGDGGLGSTAATASLTARAANGARAPVAAAMQLPWPRSNGPVPAEQAGAATPPPPPTVAPHEGPGAARGRTGGPAANAHARAGQRQDGVPEHRAWRSDPPGERSRAGGNNHQRQQVAVVEAATVPGAAAAAAAEVQPPPHSGRFRGRLVRGKPPHEAAAALSAVGRPAHGTGARPPFIAPSTPLQEVARLAEGPAGSTWGAPGICVVMEKVRTWGGGPGAAQ